jgi:hypothetical protein
MPVLGEEDVVEVTGEGVDAGNDLVSAGDGEGAADAVGWRAEVVLEVDDEEGVGGWIEGHWVGMGFSRAEGWRGEFVLFPCRFRLAIRGISA